MAETSGQEKTEAPTARRLREAREEGNVARSTDLTAALMLLASIVLLYMLSTRLFEAMAAVLHRLLGSVDAINPTRGDDLGPLMNYILGLIGWTVLPFLIAVAGVGMLVTAGQTGLMLSGKPLVPKFSKINPLSGVKRLVDARAAIRLVMSLGKVAIISAVAVIMIMSEIDAIAALPMMTIAAATSAAAHMTFMLAIKLAALLVILALLDFAFQKYQHTKDMRMTKQEVRQELKDMDGDPLMKQRRARVARQLAMQRMAQQVPQADVVITNPTHLSIALRYDSDNMRAPKVIAKGADFMAMRIRQIATANGIPLVERKPLARALYSSVEIGEEVPEEHYAAVAEILAYVYRLSGKAAS
ncbi:MAG: flagellar biosynthesis protein FlhB [Phycisphaeraceae bacterium]|nr:flagellar biosynthesis protein FlhB [Phycisphaeraceae bacterium]